ncbi:MAG TPA: SCO1664 family protein [Acidimicrobiaceae bacterium]|nr:SCO1664 family protein [Acidimicrobiaceae bacterium]
MVNPLSEGELELVGRMPWSSNGTYLVRCTLDDAVSAAVYKPGRGERQLWDFPEGIYRREVAAYLLSEMLGWGVVPDTVVREDAPLGPGSVQHFVEADFSEHHFTLVEQEENHDRLRVICAFDVVANNADRKSGHCLLGVDGTIWAIDNALCFHRQPKLRTVIWEFAGEPVPAGVLADLDALEDKLPGELEPWLSGAELEALRRRTRRFVDGACFPVPDPDTYHYPWPLV